MLILIQFYTKILLILNIFQSLLKSNNLADSRLKHELLKTFHRVYVIRKRKEERKFRISGRE